MNLDNTTKDPHDSDAAAVKITSPKQVLIAARKLIEKPENWTNKSPKIHGFPTCAGFAIERLRDGVSFNNLIEKLGFATASELIDWNDAADRTHADILAAFDKAIEAAP